MPNISPSARLRTIAALALVAVAVAVPLAGGADEANDLTWRPAPLTQYRARIRMTHVISNDLRGALKALAGSRADPVTIIEEREVAISIGSGGEIGTTTTDRRHYGGDHPKDTSVVTRTSAYKGTLGKDGTLAPSVEPLTDVGDGALSQFPGGRPPTMGQSWSFSRKILVDRELGSGTMTYTDTLTRIDTRNGHRIAVIDVKGTGRADVAQDLKAKGFATTDMTFSGTAEFDLTTGLPAAQHYVAHAKWNTRVMWVHIGLAFDDTYDADPWSPAGH